MKYLIGIDGGGTGSTCVIAGKGGNVFYRCKGGPTNFLRYDINHVCKTIFSLINDCRKSLKISFNDIGGIVIGSAGAGREKDALFLETHFKKHLKSKKISIKNLKVVSDGIIALEGAFPDEAGCILIAGTGSVIFAKNKDGKYFRAGGFGNKIGDEGSGYSIGRKGLNSVSKDFDGRGDKTLLTGYLKRNYKIDSGHKLIDKIYRDNFDIASFAPLVIIAADKKDKVSVKILNDEADELLDLLIAMKKLTGEKIIKVALLGSLISSKNYFSDLLKKKIKAVIPGIEIVKPAYPPEIGAVFLGRKLL